jgi:hypothetical protein
MGGALILDFRGTQTLAGEGAYPLDHTVTEAGITPRPDEPESGCTGTADGPGRERPAVTPEGCHGPARVTPRHVIDTVEGADMPAV